MKQVKGQSETTPGLSPNDEFANCEVFVWHILGATGSPPREPAAQAKAPSFIVSAVKDPDSANLDRIQIVKSWSKNGQSFEKIWRIRF